MIGIVFHILSGSTPIESAQNNRKSYDHGVKLPTERPLIIAHRGSSGAYPEHTVKAYQTAVDQGADVIECDVAVTKDLHLICLHESWMNSTTDVAQRFPGRESTQYVPDQGRNITDFFVVDFTLEEIRTLRVKQRFDFRDRKYDFVFGIATLDEYIQVAQNASRSVGIYPETKEPKWINSLKIIKDANTTFEDLLVQSLRKHGYTEKGDPCFIQSFSLDSLKYMKSTTPLPLVQLVRPGASITDDDLKKWSKVCYGIGPSKTHIFPVENNRITRYSGLVEAAHAVGLRVHPFTFRNEDRYLAWNYIADPYAEYEQFFNVSIDGAFTDFPASLSRYLDVEYSECPASAGRSAIHELVAYNVPWVFLVMWLRLGG